MPKRTGLCETGPDGVAGATVFVSTTRLCGTRLMPRAPRASPRTRPSASCNPDLGVCDETGASGRDLWCERGHPIKHVSHNRLPVTVSAIRATSKARWREERSMEKISPRPARTPGCKPKKQGRRPIAPPRLFVLWNHPCQNRSLSGRLNVWTRVWRSLPQPVPMLISENVGECARPSCYRVSVARATGPDPAISSVFTGLASSARSLLWVATVVAYCVCSPCAPTYSDVSPSAASGRLLPVSGIEKAPGTRPGAMGRKGTVPN